jgi:hypothetical protein
MGSAATGKKPERLPSFTYDYQGRETLMQELNNQHGILSDGFVHFTPEYYASQNWRVKDTDAQHQTLELVYFISDIQIIKHELIIPADTHARILNVIDHCVDRTFSNDDQWKTIGETLFQEGREFGDLIAKELAKQGDPA